MTLNKQGIFHLSRNTWEMMREPAGVLLFYDRINDIIGIKPVDTPISTSFPIKVTKRGYLIHAVTFCRHYKLRIENTIGWHPEGMGTSGKLLLEIKKASSVTRVKSPPPAKPDSAANPGERVGSITVER